MTLRCAMKSTSSSLNFFSSSRTRRSCSFCHFWCCSLGTNTTIAFLVGVTWILRAETMPRSRRCGFRSRDDASRSTSSWQILDSSAEGVFLAGFWYLDRVMRLSRACVRSTFLPLVCFLLRLRPSPEDTFCLPCCFEGFCFCFCAALPLPFCCFEACFGPLPFWFAAWLLPLPFAAFTWPLPWPFAGALPLPLPRLPPPCLLDILLIA